MIHRSHHITSIWKSASSTNPILPDPENLGWKKIDDEYEPFLTDKLPARQLVIELSMCSCKKTNCDSLRCSCKKKGLVCSDTWQCLNCSNIEFDKPEFTI